MPCGDFDRIIFIRKLNEPKLDNDIEYACSHLTTSNYWPHVRKFKQIYAMLFVFHIISILIE